MDMHRTSTIGTDSIIMSSVQCIQLHNVHIHDMLQPIALLTVEAAAQVMVQ